VVRPLRSEFRSCVSVLKISEEIDNTLCRAYSDLKLVSTSDKQNKCDLCESMNDLLIYDLSH